MIAGCFTFQGAFKVINAIDIYYWTKFNYCIEEQATILINYINISSPPNLFLLMVLPTQCNR